VNLIFVSATRLSASQFRRQSPLSKSLAIIGQFNPIGLQLFHDNSRALGDCYNAVIKTAADDDILVFIHDDVWIDDWMIASRLHDALLQFDVVGVAGNRRRQPYQQNWLILPGDQMQWDSMYLSGAVSHGQPGLGVPTVYGQMPAEVKLMDGVFIAAKAATLRQAGVVFDSQFAFHFYDTDFCRSCELAGLKMGIWPIAITHISGGGYQSDDWRRTAVLYWQKWNQ